MEKLLVVKLGSKSVAHVPGVDYERLNKYAEHLYHYAGRLIVVSSGSVMAGKVEAPAIKNEQILAGLGSASIVMGWKRAFGQFNILASQVPATDHEIDDPEEGDTLIQALRDDLAAGIVPIVNTNDKLSRKELEKRRWGGENDGLAAHIAARIGADVLCLLTGENGLLDSSGAVIHSVDFSQTAHAQALAAAGGRDEKGQGIRAKVEAAITATEAGVDAYIGSSGVHIQTILDNEAGTHFVARA